MKTLIVATIVTFGLAPVALAQTKSPSPASPAATTSDAAVEAKFKTADKNNNGTLDGAELDAHKSVMAQVDTDKDGKLSRAEFTAGAKAGHIR